MTCRICYEEETAANPLLRPCGCKGTSANIHKQCLLNWMHVSTKDTCEICKVPYRAEELVLESMGPMYLQYITTHTQSVFYTLLMAYILYIFYDHGSGPIGFLVSSIVSLMQIHTATIESIPYLMLLIIAIQTHVLVPACFLSLALHVLSEYMRVRAAALEVISYLMFLSISIQIGFLVSAVCTIRDKRRYGRYACSSGWPPLYLFLTIGSSVMTVWYPFIGAFVSTYLMSRLHEIHRGIVTRINRDITGVV